MLYAHANSGIENTNIKNSINILVYKYLQQSKQFPNIEWDMYGTSDTVNIILETTQVMENFLSKSIVETFTIQECIEAIERVNYITQNQHIIFGNITLIPLNSGLAPGSYNFLFQSETLSLGMLAYIVCIYIYLLSIHTRICVYTNAYFRTYLLQAYYAHEESQDHYSRTLIKQYWRKHLQYF